jgi:hypothetical protein
MRFSLFLLQSAFFWEINFFTSGDKHRAVASDFRNCKLIVQNVGSSPTTYQHEHAIPQGIDYL